MLKKRAFTLLEVLIAAVLFTTGVVVMVGLFGKGFISGFDAESTTIAVNLAERKVEEIRNLAFDDIVDEEKANVPDFTGFQREVLVSDPEGAPAIPDLKEVTVTVYWTPKTSELSVPLATYIAKD